MTDTTDKLTYPQFLRRSADRMQAAIDDGLTIDMGTWLAVDNPSGGAYAITDDAEFNQAKLSDNQCFACLGGLHDHQKCEPMEAQDDQA